MSSQPPVQPRTAETVAVVGVGLIGGSIAAAIKKRGCARRVIGVGRSRERLRAAEQHGLLDAATDSLREAATAADLLVFCTPVDRIVEGVREAAACCRPETLITDAGSVKGAICRQLDGGLSGRGEFVGSHPLAGSEKQGFEFADADLFRGRVCVVTPGNSSSPAAVERVSGFWRGLEARVVEMSPEAHDRALAETSHFPHLAAAALAGVLDDRHRHLAATGFRDTTRIAGSDPDLWTAILLQNADAVLNSLDRYAASLCEFRAALATRDAGTLRQLLATAREKRQQL